MTEQSIRGYRIYGDVKPEKHQSTDYLRMGHEAARAHRELREAVIEDGAPCQADPDAWTPDELPTDREAAIMCATCPFVKMLEGRKAEGVRMKCRRFADAPENHAYGVLDGRVFGRSLERALRDD